MILIPRVRRRTLKSKLPFTVSVSDKMIEINVPKWAKVINLF